jgi:aryl-alcohol dehydrogenase-like predicted oxidoreductase
LARLGVDVIDLYYQHRVDPEVPVEGHLTAGQAARVAAETGDHDAGHGGGRRAV